MHIKIYHFIKTGKAPGHSKASLELIAANMEAGIQMMVDLCLRLLDGLKVPAEWAISRVVPIFKGNDDIMNCSCYRAIKFLKVV